MNFDQRNSTAFLIEVLPFKVDATVSRAPAHKKARKVVPGELWFVLFHVEQ